ncbi:MAG TPA: hypothetical protein PKB15_01090 [Acidimicrobiia bacterium]|nr:hypothetical protein [Acidimicrobiia bacterium]
MAGSLDDIRDYVRERVQGRKFIFTGDGASSFEAKIEQLRVLGAGPFLAITLRTMLNAEVDLGDDVTHIEVDLSINPENFTYEDGWNELFESPTPEIKEALEKFDPEGKAFFTVFRFRTATHAFGRHIDACRRPDWIQLEDKTFIDGFFAQHSIPAPRSTVVDATRDAMTQASELINSGDGTVWSGDNSLGLNSRGNMVRWLRPDADEEDIGHFVRKFSSACESVRIAEFVEGRPCSIHGFVLADGVAVFRPVELLVLRGEHGKFWFAGTNTYWQPSIELRVEMRSIARQVGEALRREYDYRGAFCCDGIAGRNGYVINELNTRIGDGLGYVSNALPDFPFEVLQDLAVAGLVEELHDDFIETLEDAIQAAGDTIPWAKVRVYQAGNFAETVSMELFTRYQDDGEDHLEGDADLNRYTEAVVRTEDQKTLDPFGIVTAYPGTNYGILDFSLDTDIPTGPSLARHVASALRRCAEEWGAATVGISVAKDVYADEADE